MEKLKIGKPAVIAVFAAICLAAIIITVSFVAKERREEPLLWVLHSYGNNVALYNGDNVVEVYGTVVLDALPEEDKRQLDAGLAFHTKREAVSALEDYDG